MGFRLGLPTYKALGPTKPQQHQKLISFLVGSYMLRRSILNPYVEPIGPLQRSSFWQINVIEP